MLSARLAARVIVVGASLALATSAAAQGRGSGDLMMLDFWSETCGPCRSMEGTVAQLMAAGYPIRKVNINQERDLARQFQVTGIPAFVLVRGGREISRLEGAVSSGELQAMFAKARETSPAANANWTAAATGASPSASGASNGRPFVPAGKSFGPAGAGVARGAGLPAAASAVPASVCLAASVKLTVEDVTVISHGSGTLIDSRNGEALILTCAHIFRDSKGKGKVTVDVFGSNPQSKLLGQVVGYDLKRDVGLVSIRPKGPITTALVAPLGHVVRVGDQVASVGCDNGSDPTVRESRITALNRFLGPANVEVSGQPTQGRSGGGLFSVEGYVIGVCNAADPADNEGIYMASATIQTQLDQAGLASLYRRANDPPSASLASASGGASTGVASAAAGVASAAAGVASAAAPFMPARMPASPLAAVGGATSGAAPASTGGADLQRLTPQERATLGALAHTSQNAEVICIVRPLNDPTAKSEIIILDRASPAFLRQLSSEQTTQSSRHLTSLEIARYAGASPPGVATPPVSAGQAAPPANPSAPGNPPTRNFLPNWR